jgi:hypothetical protein
MPRITNRDRRGHVPRLPHGSVEPVDDRLDGRLGRPGMSWRAELDNAPEPTALTDAEFCELRLGLRHNAENAIIDVSPIRG